MKIFQKKNFSKKKIGAKSEPRWSKSVKFEKKRKKKIALRYRGHQIAEILSDFQLGEPEKCAKSEKFERKKIEKKILKKNWWQERTKVV